MYLRYNQFHIIIGLRDISSVCLIGYPYTYAYDFATSLISDHRPKGYWPKRNWHLLQVASTKHHTEEIYRVVENFSVGFVNELLSHTWGAFASFVHALSRPVGMVETWVWQCLITQVAHGSPPVWAVIRSLITRPYRLANRTLIIRSGKGTTCTCSSMW